MVFGEENEMHKFLRICNEIIPARVSLITNYGDWEDRIVMKGPHLKVSVRENGDEDMRIRISDERGMTVEVPCRHRRSQAKDGRGDPGEPVGPALFLSNKMFNSCGISVA